MIETGAVQQHDGGLGQIEFPTAGSDKRFNPVH
jgi:hypothetical protein